MSGVQAAGRAKRPGAVRSRGARPTEAWRALWAMMVGFFMILVDSTIVAVANPSIMAALDIGYDTVIWVTSAYLLAYAVPLLVAGRLGDRFGPKRLYLIGLAVFTAASLWCGLAGGIAPLIVARAVQGVGAALLTPQTLSMITRIFPAARRGVAMSVWGATAGVATLVGPLVGGVLVDGLGWEWIFFVNVPVGLAGLVLAVRWVPDLPTHPHRFDVPGVVLSGLGIFLIVFALQEGESGGWAPWIWLLLIAGVASLLGFGYWQYVTRAEPLIPLHIFADRDFSLANVAVAVIGFVSTAMAVPVMFYAQAVCGLSPTRSAVLTAPTAIISGLLAPLVGRIVDRGHPRSVTGFGFSVLAISVTWLSIEMNPDTPVWRLVLPFAAIGVGMAFIWSPLAATATRNLPPQLAGAGSGVYNATRQVGAVLGSAGMAAFMTARIGADMPDGARPAGAAGPMRLPEQLHEPFALAMSESTLLPAFVALFGVITAIFMVGYGTGDAPGQRRALDVGRAGRDRAAADRIAADERPTELIPFDDLLDYQRARDGAGAVPARAPAPVAPAVDPDTEPLRVVIPAPEPARGGRNGAAPSTAAPPAAPAAAAPVPEPEPEPAGDGGYVDEIPVQAILARYGLGCAGSRRPHRYLDDAG